MEEAPYEKERTKTGLFLVEGIHLVEEALKSGIVKELMVISPDMLPSHIQPDIELYELSEEAFSAMTETETPQHIAAVCTVPVLKKRRLNGFIRRSAGPGEFRHTHSNSRCRWS